MGVVLDDHHAGLPSDAARASGRREFVIAVRTLGIVLFLLALVLLVVSALGALFDQPELAGDVVALAIPAFVAGVFSILSPCSLPIVIGYFTLALQERRESIGRITVAFLLGVGSTMAVIGAGFTAMGSFAIDHQVLLAQAGGIVIILFGLMSMFGRGFGGLHLTRRSSISSRGAYAYGLIFALGWTTCVGPILGSILTLLLAQGSSAAGALSLVAGGTLSMIYVLGLGLPIMLLVGAMSSSGASGRLTRMLRGKGWEISLGGRILYLHSTSVISGLLLIALGIMLLTGQMTALSERLATSPLTELGLRIERWIDGIF